jgi:sulfhydrogenase subunit alpha
MVAPARTITVPHLGRIEGHGGIRVRLSGASVHEVNLDVFEGSRYYEALLVGRPFSEVQGIITRVCAICSASHTVAALGALERALGVEVSPRVHHLRGLLALGATIESHALHVFALALPDFLGLDSVLAMAGKHPAEVAFALRLKQLGNRVQELVGGRAIHPINTLVGGFGRLPGAGELRSVRDGLAAALPEMRAAVELVAGIPVPSWPEQETVFLAVRPYEEAYRFRGDVLCTTRGDEVPVARYGELVSEYAVGHSQSKHAELVSGGSYVVGALARLRLWGRYLGGQAREAFLRLFPDGVPDNVLWNTRAQAVELVHALERGVEVCDLLLAMPAAGRELAPVAVRAGRGACALEVPRGTLIHEYALDQEGRVTSANVITPTAQNLANVERDLRRAVEVMLASEPSATDARLKQGMELVVRAYDPCVSCSVHLVRGA